MSFASLVASEGFWPLCDGANYFIIVINWEQVNLSFISDLHAYSLLSQSTSDRMKIRAIKAFTLTAIFAGLQRMTFGLVRCQTSSVLTF